MYEIHTPEHFEQVSGVIRWPDLEDVDEYMWDMYRQESLRSAEWHKENAKKSNLETDALHLNFEFAVKFTLKYGEYDLGGVDLQEWLTKKSVRRLKFVSWMSRQIYPYFNKVLDPKE